MQLRYIQADIKLFSFSCEPPSWMLNVGSHHIKIYSIENMVTEFLDSKNLCMAVKELCSYVVHVLGLRYLLIVGRHLDFITSACIAQYDK